MSVGIFNTSQFTPDLAKKSFAGAITRLMPNGEAMMFGLTSMLQEETAVAVEHGFFTKTMLFPQLQLSIAAGAADTVLNVVSAANVLPGMIMRVASTGENVVINAVVGNSQVSVARGVGTTIPATIAINVFLYQVGTAYEEGSVRPQSLITNPVRITNFTQIFRNTWGITESVRATQMIAGNTNVAESKQDCAANHAKDIESALFFGQRSFGTRNGMPFRTMDGIINFVNNLGYYPSYMSAVNVFTAGGSTNYTQLEGFLDPVFFQGSDPKIGNQRLLFVGGRAKSVLNNIGRLNGTYFLEGDKTTWGLQFSVLKTSRGSFTIVEHPLFNSNVDWQRMAVAVDLSTFRLAYLRKTSEKSFNMDGEDASDNGVDAVGGTLTTELTTVVKNPPANSVIFNLTAAAAG